MIKLAQVCFTRRHVYHDGKASSAFCAQKKESQLFIIQFFLFSFFFVLQLKRARVSCSSTQSEMTVKVFCGAPICSSALSCHSSRAHRIFRQTEDLLVNVRLEEMVSRLFAHTARSPPSPFMTKQQSIYWAFPFMSETEASVRQRQLCVLDKFEGLHRQTLRQTAEEGLYVLDCVQCILC